MKAASTSNPRRYCTACGAELSDAALFCGRCGRLVRQADGTFPVLDDRDRRKRHAVELIGHQLPHPGGMPTDPAMRKAQAVALELLLTAAGIGFLIWFLTA